MNRPQSQFLSASPVHLLSLEDTLKKADPGLGSADPALGRRSSFHQLCGGLRRLFEQVTFTEVTSINSPDTYVELGNMIGILLQRNSLPVPLPSLQNLGIYPVASCHPAVLRQLPLIKNPLPSALPNPAAIPIIPRR